MATFSSSIILKFFPALFSCSKNFNMSQSSLGLEEKNPVEFPFGFDFFREAAMIAGDLGNLTRDLSTSLFFTLSSFIKVDLFCKFKH